MRPRDKFYKAHQEKEPTGNKSELNVGLASKGCKHCLDSDGECCYPWYGLRPHTHDLKKTGSIIGNTVIDRDAPLPENFEPDSEDPDCGIYTHCPECGFAG